MRLSPKLKWLLTGLWLVAVAVCAFAITVRAMLLPNDELLVVAVFSPYIMAGTLVTALLVSLVSRQWILAALTVVITAIALVGQLSFYRLTSTSDSREHATIRVLSSNLRLGLADEHFLRQLADSSADLVAMQELTEEKVRALSDSGLNEKFPYSVLFPSAGATGIGLWSRYPLERIPLERVKEVGLIVARLRIPGVRVDPYFASVHLSAPVPNRFHDWKESIAGAAIALRELADNAPASAIIAAGDYNSTPDMRDYRELLVNGYSDAVQQSGSGFAPTFPADVWYPPLLTIDHAVIRGATATSVETVQVPGTDHRAILVNVQVPLDATAS